MSKWIVGLSLALLIGGLVTLASASIARMGAAYTCQIQILPPGVLHRDERGLPFIYIKRSVQSTACAPMAYPSGEPMFGVSGHEVDAIGLATDIIFWSVVAGGAIYVVGKKVYRHA